MEADRRPCPWPGLARATRDWLSDPALRAAAEAYVQALTEHRYAASTIKIYVEGIAHFTHWSRQQHIGVCDIDETIVRQFLEHHLPHCACARRCQRVRHTLRAALKHWLVLLRTTGRSARPMGMDRPDIEHALQAFQHYLIDVCGLRPTTCGYRVRHIRHLLLQCFGAGPLALATLTPSHIDQFLRHYTARWTPRSRHVLCQSVRSYLRFQAVQGMPAATVKTLMAAVPTIAHWRLARLPQAVSPSGLTQFLVAFDRTTVVGRRDYAIARCMIDLGLRSCEVPRLTLDDVDWQAGTLRIRGKGQRTDVLPLPRETGRAIAAYLQAGRPQRNDGPMGLRIGRGLFVRHRAPRDAPITVLIVRGIIRRAAARSGVADRLTGPHRLRHTAAQRLLDGGATLKEIADVLRHRSLDTTMIYTKVDLPTLARVALPWPGSRA